LNWKWLHLSVTGSGGGTTITVTNIEQITVNDAGGNPIFTWP